MAKIITRKDIFIILAVLVIGGAIFCWQHFTAKDGAMVVVTIDGERVGFYSLDEDQIIELNGGTNVLTIEDGKAIMTYADCPDQICAEHAPVSYDGESIICLPNQVFVRVEGGGKSQVDEVAY